MAGERRQELTSVARSGNKVVPKKVQIYWNKSDLMDNGEWTQAKTNTSSKGLEQSYIKKWPKMGKNVVEQSRLDM